MQRWWCGVAVTNEPRSTQGAADRLSKIKNKTPSKHAPLLHLSEAGGDIVNVSQSVRALLLVLCDKNSFLRMGQKTASIRPSCGSSKAQGDELPQEREGDSPNP